MAMKRIWLFLPGEYVKRLDRMCDIFQLSRSQLIRTFLIVALDDISIQMSWGKEVKEIMAKEAMKS